MSCIELRVPTTANGTRISESSQIFLKTCGYYLIANEKIWGGIYDPSRSDLACCLGHQQQGWVSSPCDVSLRDFSSLRYQPVHNLFSSVLILFHKSLYCRFFSLTVFLALGKKQLPSNLFSPRGLLEFIKSTSKFFSGSKINLICKPLTHPYQLLQGICACV